MGAVAVAVAVVTSPLGVLAVRRADRRPPAATATGHQGDPAARGPSDHKHGDGHQRDPSLGRQRAPGQELSH